MKATSERHVDQGGRRPGGARLQEGPEPPFQCAGEIERVVLRDGSVIQMRQICPDDRNALRIAFARLSPASRYSRFLAPVKRLSEKQLAYLTNVDHRNHEALVATTVNWDELIGVARYIREPSRPDCAEVAIAVIDEFQGRGVATALLHELARRAHAAGVWRFSAVCLAGNRKAIDVLERLGPALAAYDTSGLTNLSIELASERGGRDS